MQVVPCLMLSKISQKTCRITCYFVELFYHIESVTIISLRKYLNVFEMDLM